MKHTEFATFISGGFGTCKIIQFHVKVIRFLYWHVSEAAKLPSEITNLSDKNNYWLLISEHSIMMANEACRLGSPFDK